MKKQKQPSPFARLMEYAGGYRILTYLSWILSFLSALTALLLLVYIYFIIREVLEVTADFCKGDLHRKIIVIKDGRSNEQGTPEELKQQNGFYNKMLSLQTKG